MPTDLFLYLIPFRLQNYFFFLRCANFLTKKCMTERKAKDGAKDKKRRSNYSFWGFNERGDSTSRICFISLISPRKKLAVSSFFENDSSLHDFLSRGLPHQQAANEESTLLKGGKLNKQSPWNEETHHR